MAERTGRIVLGKLKQWQGFSLPAVIPAVLCHGRVRWQAATESSALVRCPRVLDLRIPDKPNTRTGHGER